jgi:thiol-disulfide isomerase/thioredoxin
LTGPAAARQAVPPVGAREAPARVPGPKSSGREADFMTAHWRAPAGLHVASARLPVEGELPSFDSATGWLNSEPLTPAGLRGKVVLAGFWTYTCVNWLRQLPYLRAWAEKYAGHGLAVIGIHTPEFSFEHNPRNVQQAMQDMRITYPVATDNNYGVWQAFDNHYWPALYFADAQGHIRHHHFGEGEYARSEMVIQQLLAEAGSTGAGTDMVSVDPAGLEVSADWASLRSPENYTGYERTEGFASSGGPVPGRPHVYTVPARLGLNQWALAGDWTMAEEASMLNAADGRIACRFHARDLNLVIGPAAAASPVRFRVLIDGQPPGAAHGTDVDGDGDGTITQQRTYQLIRQPGPITDRTFEMTFPSPGAQSYCFTFG